MHPVVIAVYLRGWPETLVLVQEFLVLKGERRQLMGQGKDNMDVARGEKFLTTRLQPTSTGVGLTLRAVPVAAANGELTITCIMGRFF
jgi:hypothetical protein